ncbi:MAG: Eco57I restriction-modification methylase domain-containing protein, partial [Sulfurihydrogenibium sp.]
DLKELKEIEKQEQDIFKEIVDMKVQELERKGKSLATQISALKSQKGLYGDERTKKEKEQIKKLEKELAEIKSKIDKYLTILQTIGSKTQKDYFLWELDFIEVFSQKGGFDIVIGNPPYVRQELIAPPLENKNNYTDDKWREIKKAYKEKLIQSVENTWNVPIKIDRKSDLYVYFYYQGLSLLRPGGVFTFINSNSWLDVGYGAGLQEFLLKNMKPLFIFDNLKK